MADLGDLRILLEANIADFTRNMNEAANRTEAAGKRMDASMGAAKAAILSLASAATVGAFAVLVKGAIDAADNLRDMSQKTGVAVEQLNGLGFAASQAGGNLESMVAAAGKLNKSVADAANGGKETGAAFKALGIDVVDASGNLKKADVVMAELADQFQRYQDGPEKTALALAIFGKAGADMIPILNDGGKAMRENIEYAKQYSGQTTELSNASDNFNDTLGKLEVQQRGFANAMASEMLPIIQTVANELLGAAEASNRFEVASKSLGIVMRHVTVQAAEAGLAIRRVGIVLAGVAAISDSKLNPSAARAAYEGMTADLNALTDAHARFKSGIEGTGFKIPKFDAWMAGREQAVADERALLETRNMMLNKYNADGLLTQKEYNKAKEVATAESIKNTKALYDQQIGGLRLLQSQIPNNLIPGVQGKIDALSAKQSLLGHDRPAAPRLPSTGKPPAKAGKSEQEKALDEGVRFLANLKDQEAALGLTGVAAVTFKLSMAGLKDEQILAGAVAQTNIDNYNAEEKAIKEAAEAQKKKIEEDKRAVEQNIINVEQIRQGFLSEAEAEEEAHQKRLKQLRAYLALKIETEIDGHALLEAEDARYKQAVAERQAMHDIQSVQMAGDVAGELYGVMQRAGKEQSALGKAAFLVSKALAVAEIIMQTNVAASKAKGQLGIFGIPMEIQIMAVGYARAGMVAGMALAEVSAENGYDIPAGKNPVAQLHEKEMVLPKAQADVIRGLAAGGGGAGGMKITIVNQTTGRIDNVVEKQISPTEKALIIQESIKANAAQFADPNSETSRSMSRHYNVPRSR